MKNMCNMNLTTRFNLYFNTIIALVLHFQISVCFLARVFLILNLNMRQYLVLQLSKPLNRTGQTAMPGVILVTYIYI